MLYPVCGSGVQRTNATISTRPGLRRKYQTFAGRHILNVMNRFNPIALRDAKIVYNFGLSEYNKGQCSSLGNCSTVDKDNTIVVKTRGGRMPKSDYALNVGKSNAH